MTNLSIVILNYNTADLTINCINSINEQYGKELEKDEFEIILVDNGSTDDSVKKISKIKNKISNFKIIESKENLGFSKGCNLGAKNATGEYLLFLNSDTEIKDQGFKKMVNFLNEKKEIGILGGKLKNPDGSNQLSSGKFYNLFNLFLMLFGFNKFLRESPNETKKVDWVSGASLMIRRNLFEKLGGFDKDIFMYMEDMEICFRAGKKGFSTYFYPEIMLFHKELGSADKTFAILHIYSGIIHFYKKHKSKIELLIAKTMLFTKAFLLNTFGKLTKNSYYINTYGQALKLF